MEALQTEKEYFKDTYKFEMTAKITAIEANPETQEPIVVLDKTIFHPQGGGQPHDKGFMESLDGKTKFEVAEMKDVAGKILHAGKYANGTQFTVGQEVKLLVDAEFRKIHARVHSAGHLLDMAMNRAGKQELKPGKGYHFVEGPYVEYNGVIDEKERESLIGVLNKHCADIIAEAKAADAKVFKKMCTYEEAQKELAGAGGVPPYVKEGQDLRVLKLTAEDLGCPCGGTHVDSVTQIVGIEVLKIRKKKQNTQNPKTPKPQSPITMRIFI